MIARKAWADLRSSPARTLLAIVALIVGVWGVGGILVSWFVLGRDLRDNYRSTRPPHAVLVADDFSRLDLAELRRRPDVESAEFRDLSLQRIEVRPGEWIPLWLFGVDDFGAMQLATLRSERGAASPPPGTMAMERDGRLVSQLDLGSRAKVRVGARVLELPISEIAFDPAQAPATQDHFIYGYVDAPTYAQLTGEATRRRLLVRFRDVISTADAKSKAERLVADLATSGVVVRSMKVPELDRHPHQWQLDTLLLLEGAIGGLACMMAAMLVAQLIASILAAQTRQIGVLKALGASRAQVLSIYVTMTATLGAAAALAAVPLAIWSGYAFAGFVAAKLNFDVRTRHLPLWLDVALVAASVLLPVLVSLPRVLGATRISVLGALGDYGLAPEAVASSPRRGPLARVTSLLRRLPFELRLAFSNVLRRRSRALVVGGSMALGVAILGTGFDVRASLAQMLHEFRDSMRHDVQVVLSVPTTRERALAPFAGVPGVDRIEAWSGGRGELQSMVTATADGVGVVALPRDTDLFHPRIVAGRWLGSPPSASSPGAPVAVEVVMNSLAATAFGRPAVGEELTILLGGKPLRVRLVGVVEELEKAKVYVDRDDFDAAANPQHLVNSLMFVARDTDYASVMRLKSAVEAALEGTDLHVLYVMSQAERVKIIYDHLDIVLTAITLLSMVVLLVSALGMASATGIGVLERAREIGVLRAMGATPRTVLRLFVLEGMITSVLGIAVGLALTWPLTSVASVFFGRLMLGEGAVLRPAFSGAGFVVTLVVTVVFAWLASRVPARRAARRSTREALAYDG